MNKARRKEIDQAITLLSEAQAKAEEAKGILESAKDEEAEYRNNLPENMQNSERADMADSAVSALDDADSSLDSAIDDIESIVSNLESACGSAEEAKG